MLLLETTHLYLGLGEAIRCVCGWSNLDYLKMLLLLLWLLLWLLLLLRWGTICRGFVVRYNVLMCYRRDRRVLVTR